MFKKISNKLIISYSLLLFILIISMLITFNNILYTTHLYIIKREMDEKVNFIKQFLYNKNIHTIDKTIANLSKIINLRITIIDFKGYIIADSYVDISSMDNHLYRSEVRDAINKGTGESIRYSNTLKTEMLYFTKKSDNYIIRLAKPLQEINDSLSDLRTVIIIKGIAGMFFIFIIVIYLTKKITSPIKETLDFTEHFSDGNYSYRILNYSNDEIGTLQRALNKMADLIVDKINSYIFEQKKLQITIENIHDGIAVIDNSKKLLIANNAFKQLLNIDSSALNKYYYESIRSSSLNSKIEYSLEKGLDIAFEEKLHNEALCEVYINPIKDEESIQGILIILYDITEKKRLEQIKTDLVANMSHELKTPIAILKGYIETIKNNINNRDMISDFLDRAHVNVDRQAALINDILKLNRIETTRDFPSEKVSIKEIIQNCIEILRSKAMSKGIEFLMHDNSIDAVVMSNRFLVEEVMFNLIDNAINYNINNGKICIEFEKSFNMTVVKISDTGIGIPQHAIDRIFERFYRVDKSRSRATGGTGLGLAIVKHVVELLGWTIKASSNEQGTTFEIEIENIL